MKTKKVFAFLLSLIMVFAFAACGSSESAEEAGPTDSGTLGDYDVTIKDCQVVTDFEGNSAIAITYDFTNNSDDATSFMVAMDYSVFQDGVELEYTSVYTDADSLDAMDDATWTDIQPGTTLEVTTTHKLNDTTNPVEVEVMELWSTDDSEKLVKPFEIA